MHTVLTIITPVFGIMLLGFGAARLGWFDTASNRGLSLFVFNFAIPPMMFRNLALAELPVTPPWGLLMSYFLGAFSVFGLGMLASGYLFHRNSTEIAIGGFSAAFANTVLMGIPLVLTTFGEQAALPLFLLLAFHSSLLMPVVTVALELGRGSGKALRQLPKNTLLGLLTNPVIVALVLGLAWNIVELPIPSALDGILQMLGKAAPSCALFAMGAALSQYRIAGNLSESCLLVLLKTLLHPLLVWLLATYVFALPSLWTHVAVLLAALPTGVNAYLFAQRYRTGVATATTTIFLGTAFSLLSVTGLLMLLTGR